MAKVTITLEDHAGEISVSMDMSGTPINAFGSPKATPAVRMSQTLFDVAAVDAKLHERPAHARQPPSMSIH
ncbi:hypothetical protein D9M68_456130 [compost metagenome]